MQNEMRDRLIELLYYQIFPLFFERHRIEYYADLLLENGVILPPCKVGDTVYVITIKTPCHACMFCTDFCHKTCNIDDRNDYVVKKATVYSISFGEIDRMCLSIEESKTTYKYTQTYWFDDLGKTVFLTRKEAEAKIKEKQMKATLKLENGKEIAVEITEGQMQEIEKLKKTEYERVEGGDSYYVVDAYGCVDAIKEVDDCYDEKVYSIANYYSDKTVAENNARADTLMRKLRRFAVEHREHSLDWKLRTKRKYQLVYHHSDETFYVGEVGTCQIFGTTYFDSKETALAAIEEFKDELVWYFTEYKDSL